MRAEKPFKAAHSGRDHAGTKIHESRQTQAGICMAICLYLYVYRVSWTPHVDKVLTVSRQTSPRVVDGRRRCGVQILEISIRQMSDETGPIVVNVERSKLSAVQPICSITVGFGRSNRCICWTDGWVGTKY